MIASNRFGVPADPHGETLVAQGQDPRFEFSLDTATRWAHAVGRGLGTARHWIESEAMENRPLTTLGVAFGLGVFTGWLVKRR
jgi:hypothetical protein